MRFKQLFQGVLTYLIVIPLITFSLLELSLRIYDAVSPSFVFPDNRGNRWRGKPHSYHYDFRINSQGFNDKEYDKNKSPGAYRVVALGDSFLYGVVPYEANFLTLMEEQLNRDGNNVEVINMGIADTAPRHYHALFVKEGLAWNPDLVLVHLFIGNDFLLPERVRSYAIYVIKALIRVLPEYEGAIVNKQERYRDKEPTMTRERFFEVETQRIEMFDPSNDWVESQMDAAMEYVVQIAEICRSRSIVMLAVLIPDELQVNTDLQREISVLLPGRELSNFDFEYPNRLLRNKLEASGIPFVDLLDAFREHQKKEPTYKPRDTHWNIAGNRTAAEMIGAVVRERFLPPRPEGSNVEAE